MAAGVDEGITEGEVLDQGQGQGKVGIATMTMTMTTVLEMAERLDGAVAEDEVLEVLRPREEVEEGEGDEDEDEVRR